MKKIMFILSLVCLFAFASCTTTKTIQPVDEISQMENGSYKITGKYNTFICENEDELEILKKHPLVKDAKYNFLKDIPHFFDYKIYLQTYPNGEQYYYVHYTTNYNPDLVIKYCQILAKDYLIIIYTTEFSNEEWNDFEEYLNDIKQLRITELEKYNKEQEIKALEEQKRIKENYGFTDLVNYMCGMPGSTLPNEGSSFYVEAPASFYIEDASIDGKGVDYLCSYAGQYGLIYIYGENLETMPNINRISFHSLKPFTLTYTGKTAPALSKYGNRVEIPIFIAK